MKIANASPGQEAETREASRAAMIRRSPGSRTDRFSEIVAAFPRSVRSEEGNEEHTPSKDSRQDNDDSTQVPTSLIPPLLVMRPHPDISNTPSPDVEKGRSSALQATEAARWQVDRPRPLGLELNLPEVSAQRGSNETHSKFGPQVHPDNASEVKLTLFEFSPAPDDSAGSVKADSSQIEGNILMSLVPPDPKQVPVSTVVADVSDVTPAAQILANLRDTFGVTRPVELPGTTLRMILHPESLGEVRINLQMNGGDLKLLMEASGSVTDLLRKDGAQLLHELNAIFTGATNVSIEISATTSETAGFFNGDDPQTSHSAAGGQQEHRRASTPPHKEPTSRTGRRDGEWNGSREVDGRSRHGLLVV